MRKTAVALLLLITMTGTAFAAPETENVDFEQQQEPAVEQELIVEPEPEDVEAEEAEAEEPAVEAEAAESESVKQQKQTIDVKTEGTEPGDDPGEEMDLSKVTMTLKKPQYYKTGSPIEPIPRLTYQGESVSKDKYTVSYANNVNVGTATVTATFDNGTKSVNFKIVPPKPKKARIKSVKSKLPKVVVKWKKVDCTGYELQVSRKSSFKKAKVFKVKGNKKNKKKIGKLKDGKKYYFRVRAYNKENGKTTYGKWSKYKCKVHTTGVVGNKYSQNGKYVKDKTVKIDGNYYYYNEKGIRSGCSKTMWTKVRNSSSGTRYLIAVDCTQNRLCVYQGKKGKWKLKSYWMCTTGAPSRPTIKGSFSACGKVSHFGEENGYSVWYATRIKYEYYIHSVLYKPYSKTELVDGRLGVSISHGCIRLAIKNALWVYNNCGSGTRIITY